MVAEFLKYWRETAIIDDRRGLIGEFLTEAHSRGEYGWITWDLTGCAGEYRSFITIGLWSSAEEFYVQIGKYFEGSSRLESFEAERRIRTVLKPKCWRMGDATLPVHDSGGVR